MLGAIAFLIQNLTNNLLIHARLGLFFLILIVVTEGLGRAYRTAREQNAT